MYLDIYIVTIWIQISVQGQKHTNIPNTETFLNKYANIIKRLKHPQTNIWMYLRPRF